MSDDLTTVCPDCGEKELLDSGPLGLNCFSARCTAESKRISAGWLADYNRREAARLLALAEAQEKAIDNVWPGRAGGKTTDY